MYKAYEKQDFVDVANAIRNRTGKSAKLVFPDDYSNEITDIPNSYTVFDEGKVVSNGALVVQTARSTQITQNGTYDTTLNNSIIVNVSGSSTLSDNDLLFHFEDFKNNGKISAAFNNIKGYEISDEQHKFGNTSLKISSAPNLGGAVFLPYNFTIGNNDFTLDFWMYQTSSDETIPNCAVSFSYRSLGYYSRTGAMRGLNVASSNGSWSVIREPQTESLNILNAWHHVAITRNNGTMHVFVDGVEEDTFTFSNSFASMSILSFGTNSTDQTRWRGYIDEFRLKVGEAVWTADFAPPTQPYM